MKEQTNNHKGIMEKITDFTLKVSEPLGRLANTDAIYAVSNGLTVAMPVIMIGSLFLILSVLGTPALNPSGHALIGFLEPYAEKFGWMNNVTMGFMALYCAVSIPMYYAERKNINEKSAALLGLATFVIININGFDEAGGINVSSFSASGLFVCIMTSLISVRIYKLCVDKNFTIKMPASVPPNVGTAFTSLIPYALSFTAAWLIRTFFEFDLIGFMNSLLLPIISSSDTVWMAIFTAFITLLLWSVGLHGDNMFMSLLGPISATWLNGNIEALQQGVATFDLPFVYAGTQLVRLTLWTASIWPLIFLMITSRNKYFKTLGIATAGPGIFTIVEPVIYGLPVALNPYLMIPFVLSGTIANGVGFLLMSTSFFGKFYATVPWAVPPFLFGPIGTGDWKTCLIPLISFAIGLAIYIPFWRVYVRKFEKDAVEVIGDK